jgi:hypothetical protein
MAERIIGRIIKFDPSDTPMRFISVQCEFVLSNPIAGYVGGILTTKVDGDLTDTEIGDTLRALIAIEANNNAAPADFTAADVRGCNP